MIRRILVPLDGSRRAEGVLPHLLTLAGIFGARLDLLHVIPSGRSPQGWAPADPLGARMVRADRTRYLDRTAERLRAHGVEVWTRIEEGGPAAVIVDILRRGGHDLVALTPHGSGDDRNLAIGCTALAVILNARIGFLLAPPAEPMNGGGELVGAVYRRILAPVDCSPRGDWPLGLASSIARGTRARLRIVHVLDVPEVVSRRPRTAQVRAVAHRLREENRSEARRYLEEVTSRLDRAEGRVECEVLDPAESSAEALVQLAASTEVDLVVLSAHGRGASAAWPFGGTAAKLALAARRPILILQDLPLERFRPERVSRPVRALASDL